MDSETLARRFDELRPHLVSVAFQVVGSMPDAEDVIQAVWLKVASSDTGAIANLGGWLTTITTRTALDTLKARHRRRETFVGDYFPREGETSGPDAEVLLAESVSRALLVVLERLSPAERVAFVMHDVFAMPFDEIGNILDRTAATSKKLASRARTKIHAAPTPASAQIPEHTKVVKAFLAASRGSDIPTLLELLAPDVIRTVDPILVAPGASTVIRGAAEVADETRQFTTRAKKAAVVLIDGEPGVVIAPFGRLLALMTISFDLNGQIRRIDITADRSYIDSVTLTLPTAGGE
ncbi:sigma-70 family RNA polymerase sigma factor [Rhodococcus erythropolis]|uniref:sigma-70 family RNA polymerase sigma factor n=1 Tax=Rhodococcus erythropolis TaxID=1833 RepID=UPI0012915415|nr:sigma-70 family RNA polymerase sigma factor [Rhodococcus erythropolis]MQP33576.1 sigma-70 family RNA polymerase sigma factor [Rhodococcus erythropolis]